MTAWFFMIGILFLFLPFLPTIVEVLKQTDAAALKITTHILKDPRTDPDLIFWHSTRVLNLVGLKDLKVAAQVTAPTQLHPSILALPGGTFGKIPRNTARIVSAEDIELLEKTPYASKILSFGSITTGAGSVLNEIHSRETLTLKNKSKVYWWASGKRVVVEGNVKLPGKTQASADITFQSQAFFHLLESPLIKGKSPILLKRPHSVTPTGFRSKTELKRFQGDYQIAAAAQIHSTLIVKGDLVLGKNSSVFGDIKCRGKIILEPGAHVLGNLIAQGEVVLMGDNFISGSVLAKKSITASPHCQIGTADHQITFSGENLTLHAPFEVHGLMRAWKTGEIKES